MDGAGQGVDDDSGSGSLATRASSSIIEVMGASNDLRPVQDAHLLPRVEFDEDDRFLAMIESASDDRSDTVLTAGRDKHIDVAVGTASSPPRPGAGADRIERQLSPSMPSQTP